MALIILVDDDHDILTLGKALLSQAGHTVLTATGAIEAVDLMKQFGCDALITDANMPHHSGYDLLRTVRNNAKWKELPIAMLTGRRERKDIERAVQLGVDDYIVKPIDPVLFIQKINHLCAKALTEKPEIDLARANLSASKGVVQTPVELRSLSEMGLVLKTPTKLVENSVVQFELDLFKEIGCPAPLAKVISSTPFDNGFESRLLFIGAEDSTLSKIRSWIFTHATKMRKVS